MIAPLFQRVSSSHHAVLQAQNSASSVSLGAAGVPLANGGGHFINGGKLGGAATALQPERQDQKMCSSYTFHFMKQR